MTALLLAAFGTALGFGSLLPLLPVYLQASAAEAAWHTGALPAVFLTTASICAPLWGRLSDAAPRARVALAGLALVALAPLPFAVAHSLGTLYAYQALAGAGFGAVAPVGLAILYETAAPQDRPRRVAWFGGATLAGYLAGPALGGTAAAASANLPAHVVVLLALGVQSFLALAALAALAASGGRLARPLAVESTRARGSVAIVAAVLLTAFMIGTFEIVASLYVRSPLHLGARDVALIFVACSAAMIVALLAVLPRLAPDARRGPLALGCLSASAILLAAMAFVQSHAMLLVLGALQGAALGLAAGLLNLEAAAAGGNARGVVLGYQNAALNAGQAAGSAAGAAAFIVIGVAALPALGAALLVVAVLLERALRPA